MTEQSLHLGGVRATLAEACGEGMPTAVGAKPGDAGVGGGGEHDLGDAGVGERAALPRPGGAGVAAAHVEPC